MFFMEAKIPIVGFWLVKLRLSYAVFNFV